MARVRHIWLVLDVAMTEAVLGYQMMVDVLDIHNANTSVTYVHPFAAYMQYVVPNAVHITCTLNQVPQSTDR